MLSTLTLLRGTCIQSQSIPSLAVLYIDMFEMFQAGLLVYQLYLTVVAQLVATVQVCKLRALLEVRADKVHVRGHSCFVVLSQEEVGACQEEQGRVAGVPGVKQGV